MAILNRISVSQELVYYNLYRLSTFLCIKYVSHLKHLHKQYYHIDFMLKKNNQSIETCYNIFLVVYSKIESFYCQELTFKVY